MPVPKDDLTCDDVRRLLNYNPNTGIFKWKEYRSHNARPGYIAGYYDPEFKYIVIRIGKLYLAHRLAWLHYYGEWPILWVDHINKDCRDNRIKNLRQVTKTENSFNSKKRMDNESGFRGVCLYKPNGKWRARITVHGKERSLGYFNSKVDAAKAYSKAVKEIFGET